MPLYEYACRKCSHAFEVLAPARSDTPPRCPACDAADVDRLLALPAAGRAAEGPPATNCRGDGPPCGAPWCGRKT